MFPYNTPDGRHCLGLATSPDGIKWAVVNDSKPILEPQGDGEDSAWEGQKLGSPRMVEMGDGTVRLYYTGTKRRRLKKKRTNKSKGEKKKSAQCKFRPCCLIAPKTLRVSF